MAPRIAARDRGQIVARGIQTRIAAEARFAHA
jgi:hypothetical protein